MRFVMLMHPDPRTAYAGPGVPDAESVAKMGVYNRALMDAGALVSADGFHGPDRGARVRYAGGRATVSDGPFPESREILGGYWMIEVASKDEAVAWARRIPGADGDMVEVRQVFEMSDFPPDVRIAADNPTVRAQIEARTRP